MSLLALTLAAHRRQGLARKFMELLEEVTEKVHNGYFVDLFVRVSNTSAIAMYTKVCCHCFLTQPYNSHAVHTHT